MITNKIEKRVQTVYRYNGRDYHTAETAKRAWQVDRLSNIILHGCLHAGETDLARKIASGLVDYLSEVVAVVNTPEVVK